MKNFLLLITIILLFGCSETKKETIQNYKAGFKTIHTTDRSRNYKPGFDTTNYLYFRPLDIDIWYPAAAASATDTFLLFRDLLGLLEKRANYYTASNAGDGMTQQLAQYFCEGLKCSDSTRLLNFKTQTIKNTTPADGKFPLVIYLSSFNGMSYENFMLFEELAKRGFVVASISSIGRFPGDMSMKFQDLAEQFSDAMAAISHIQGNANIDPSKIGIIGYSWGALAGAIVANKIPNVTSMISLDGSEFHRYGTQGEENADFDSILYSQDFRSMNIAVPYLRLESPPSTDPNEKVDSVYNFSEKLSGEKHIFQIDSAKHEDFSCLPTVVRQSGNCIANQRFKIISDLAIAFLEDHLKKGNRFEPTVQEVMNKTIRAR